MLTVNNLNFKYDYTPILKDISFKTSEGEHLCIIGPNGCGKTTLLKNIAGLLDYDGSITINTKQVKSISKKEMATTVGLMNQVSQIYFPYTVYDTVALGRYAHISGVFNRLSTTDCNIIDDCIHQVGLYALKDTLIDALSGGQLQRVFLARILAQDPKLILLDEPTNHLDLKYQIELLDFITQWAKQEKRTVIGVLHDLNLVHAFADRVILLKDGQIYAMGTPSEVLTKENLIACYGLDIKSWMLDTLDKWQSKSS